MRGSWAGDEDLGDGSLQALFECYKERCSFVKSIGSAGRSTLLSANVQKLLLDLESDFVNCCTVLILLDNCFTITTT